MKRHAWLGTVPTDWVAALLMALCGFCLIVSVWLESGNGAATLNFGSSRPGGRRARRRVLSAAGVRWVDGSAAAGQPARMVAQRRRCAACVGARSPTRGRCGPWSSSRAKRRRSGSLRRGRRRGCLSPGSGCWCWWSPDSRTGRSPRRGCHVSNGSPSPPIVVLAICQAFAPDRLDGVAASTPIPNPLGVDSMRPLIGVMSGVAASVIVGFVCVAIVDLVRRVRAAPPTLREQLRWVALALAPLPLLIAAVASRDHLGPRRRHRSRRCTSAKP